MPRPPKCRRVALTPRSHAFKPAGIPGRAMETVTLGLDEMEALRLADMEGLYHAKAAERMGISRPTFGRLLERARHKVVSALFESRMLLFKGGPYRVTRTRVFLCHQCNSRFEEPFGTGRPAACPHCHGRSFQREPATREEP